MLEFLALSQQCAPTVAPQTMAAIVNVESSYNPYAIGVVGGRLARQPATRNEAVATAKALAADGWNFSVGVAQVNRYNLPKYEISYEQAFEACTNLRVGSKILEDCFVRAAKRTPDSQGALQAAFSCYYSGNFTRGFWPDAAGQPSYVQRVVASADTPAQAIEVVPAIKGAAARPQATPAASGAVRLKASPTTPADNAPVLLRREGAAPVVTPGRPAGDPPVTNSAGTAATEGSNAKPAQPAQSTIVF
jgi:type IV secretion system protein VirB1